MLLSSHNRPLECAIKLVSYGQSSGRKQFCAHDIPWIDMFVINREALFIKSVSPPRLFDARSIENFTHTFGQCKVPHRYSKRSQLLPIVGGAWAIRSPFWQENDRPPC